MEECMFCSNPVFPQNEVDVQVGVMVFYGDRICEECLSSSNEGVKSQIQKYLEEKETNPDFPF